MLVFYIFSNMYSDIEQLIEQLLDEVIDSKCNNTLEFFIQPVEQIIISKVLIRTNGNQTKAAKILGISRSTLNYKLKLIQQRTK